MTGACLLCGSIVDVHGHHVTGRPAPGAPYLDSLVVGLCQRHHGGTEGVHVLLRAVGAEWPTPGRDLVAHRLHRLGLTAVLVADAGRPFVLDPGAGYGLGALALVGAASIDRAGRAEPAFDLAGTDLRGPYTAQGVRP